MEDNRDAEALARDMIVKRPQIGQTVNIGGRIGEICAEDDPRRSGTFTSKKYGALPIRWLGDRKARRREAALQRKAKK